MYNLDIKKKKMKITIYGEEHQVRFPTIEEIENFDVDFKNTEPKDYMTLMKNYLVNLGLSIETLNKLDSVDFSELVSFVNNPTSKKK